MLYLEILEDMKEMKVMKETEEKKYNQPSNPTNHNINFDRKNDIRIENQEADKRVSYLRTEVEEISENENEDHYTTKTLPYVLKLMSGKKKKDVKEREKELNDLKPLETDRDRDKEEFRNAGEVDILNEEAEKLSNSQLEKSFSSSEEKEKENVIKTQKNDSRNYIPKISFQNKESFDIEEKKRNRLQNNLKFLNSMNFIKQDTPGDKRTSEDTSNSLTAFSNMNTVNLQTSGGAGVASTILSPSHKLETTKFHSNNNIIMPVKKKPSRLINNLGLLFNKLVLDNQFNYQNTQNSQNTLYPQHTSISNNQVNNFSSASVVETPPFILKDEDTPERMDLKNKALLRKRTLNCRIPHMYDWLRESIVSSTKLNFNQGNVNDHTQEIKQLRKELTLYKTTVQNLSSELEFLRSNNINVEKIICEFQENQKKIFDVEIENLNQVIKVYKSFYEEELLGKRKVIEELAKIIDEIYLNTNCKDDSFNFNTAGIAGLNINRTDTVNSNAEVNIPISHASMSNSQVNYFNNTMNNTSANVFTNYNNLRTYNSDTKSTKFRNKLVLNE